MKVPKMLLPYGNKTIIEKVIENVLTAGIEKVILVLGSDRENILARIANMPVTNCYNGNYKEGMFSSVKCGFSNLDKECKAALITLGDQPGIKPETIIDLVDAYIKSGKGIVLPVYSNKRGHPLIIDCKYSREVQDIDSTGTLRDLVYKHNNDIFELEVNSESVLKDIDNQEDYMDEIKQIS